MYLQSCDEYKHQGRNSGSYWIDPDGSGPIAPFRVSCDITGETFRERAGSGGTSTCPKARSALSGDKVWTVLKNNLTPQTSVTRADQEGKAVLQITYNVTDDQVDHQTWSWS